MPQDSVTAYTPLIFSHPRIGSLKIDTGMTSIKWSYGLNTRSDQTYGGEVVQVLSCFADQMTITGETRNNAELKRIYDWFRSYMEQAGLHRRDERHVLFEYPERKWRFWIQPTQAPAMRFGTELIATPWSITSEIVQDDIEANALVEHTMSNFTSSILDKNFFDIGFQNFDPRNDPNGYPGPSFAQGLADNYQALLGSWAGGDYAHWGFDPLQSTSANNLPQNTKDYWMKLIGTDYIAGTPASGTGLAGGSVVYAGGPKTTDPVQIAGLIKTVLQTKGYQNWAWLAIAIGLVESGLNPNNRGNPASIGLFQPQIPPYPSRVSQGDPHYQNLRNAANHPHDPAVNYYSTQAQVEDFCSRGWFLNPSYINQSHPEVWATNAQGPRDTAAYQQKVLSEKSQAEALLKKFIASGPGTGTYGALASSSLKYAGPDQGVDFTGTGKLFAVADCRVTHVDRNSGWPGGTLIAVKLTNPVSRPAIGITATHIYYAEALVPYVKVGDHLLKGALVASLNSSYPGSETGWARDGSGSAYGSPSDGKPGGGVPKYGIDFGNFVKSQ